MNGDSTTLIRTAEETQLAGAVRAFGSSRLPIANVRRIRELPAGQRLHAAQWQELLELGWPILNLPSDVGGADAGIAVLAVVAEELARTISDVPLVSSAIAAACLLDPTTMAASDGLTELTSGASIVVLAAQESRHHDPFRISTQALRAGNEFTINGSKTAVSDADIADRFVVAARTSGSSTDLDGVSLFLVDARRSGISRRDVMGVDGRWFSRVTFDEVRATRAELIGDLDQGAARLSRAFDIGALLTAAEMAGAAAAAFETTLAFLKEREQFGVPIGSFQALQHRIARVWVALELATAAVSEAARAFDRDPDASVGEVSMAKAMINDAFRRVTAEGVQMHGGFGMTDEADIGLFLKRARVAEQSLGTTEFHRDRFASTLGF